jgi:hypothetical protein
MSNEHISDTLPEVAEEEQTQVQPDSPDKPGIHPELESLLDQQDQRSYDELKKSIQANGIMHPIIVWTEENVVIDGHTRLKIAEELGVPFRTSEMSFPDLNAAKEWIIRNQLGRRNLTPVRFEYYIGQLYNEKKEREASKKPEIEIAAEFDIAPVTVKRYGNKAKGIDVVGRLKGKLAKDKQLSNKPTYSGEELEAIAGSPNLTTAKRTVDKIDSYKEAARKTKAEAKKTKAAVDTKKVAFKTVLAAPEFEAAGFDTNSTPKPPLDKDSMVFMVVPDEYLSTGMKLLEKWGLTYQGSMIYTTPSKPYPSTFTKVTHQYVLLGSKGHPMGPKAGQEPVSVTPVHGDFGAQIAKVMGLYPAEDGKRLDMRRGAKGLPGFEVLK